MSDRKDSCMCGGIHDVGAFSGWDDFDKTERALKASADFVEVPVTDPYSNVGLTESWYECQRCKTIWRLVEPDAPFAGLWKRVS